MTDIIDWVKSKVPAGTDLSELEALASKYMATPADKEAAISLMSSLPVFSAARDSLIGKAIMAHDEKWKAEELPKIEGSLKASLMKELHPEETADQKRIRELEDFIAAQKKATEKAERKEALRAKAKELEFDSDLAVLFADLPDSDAVLESFASKYRASIEAAQSKAVQGKFAQSTPKAGGKSIDVSKMTLDEAMAVAKQSPEMQELVIAQLSKKG